MHQWVLQPGQYNTLSAWILNSRNKKRRKPQEEVQKRDLSDQTSNRCHMHRPLTQNIQNVVTNEQLKGAARWLLHRMTFSPQW